MSASPFRRWNPDGVITRRKRLFWLIPLLGLISGIAFSFAPLLQWKTAAGTLQIRTQNLPGETTPLFTPTDLADAIPSDEVVGKTAIALHLSEGRQVENQEPVASLRTRISCRPIPGTDLVELSAKGSDRADADRIWLGLISSANEHFRARKAEITRTRLATIALEIEDKRIDVEAILGAIHPPGSDLKLDYYDNPLDLRGPSPGFIEDLKALDRARRSLEALQIKQISSQMMGRHTVDPVIIYESPTARDSNFHSGLLGSLAFAATIGLAAGTFVALILAYLLESISPRNRPTSA